MLYNWPCDYIQFYISYYENDKTIMLLSETSYMEKWTQLAPEQPSTLGQTNHLHKYKL